MSKQKLLAQVEKLLDTHNISEVCEALALAVRRSDAAPDDEETYSEHATSEIVAHLESARDAALDSML